MKEALRFSPAKGVTLFHPPGRKINWELFSGFFRSPEPAPDMRKKPRPQRKVFIYDTPAGRYHIKKFSYLESPRFRDRFRGFFFQRSGAVRYASRGALLNRTGLKTVFPWSAVEKREGLRKQSLFITPVLNMPQLADILLSPGIRPQEKLSLFAEAVSGLRRMHARGITHGDAHTGNILVDKGGLVWCDLDRVRKNRILLELKGRYYDCFFLFRSAAASIITSGSWDENIQSGLVDIFEREYPGFGLIKKRVYRSTSLRQEKFTHLSGR